jgi:hypothetical protein
MKILSVLKLMSLPNVSNCQRMPLVGSVAVKQTRASVEDIDDDDMLVNDSPKNPNVVLEAADGSDDNDDDMDPMPELEDTEPYGEDDDDDDDADDNSSHDEPEIIKPVETAEAQRGEYIMWKGIFTQLPY